MAPAKTVHRLNWDRQLRRLDSSMVVGCVSTHLHRRLACYKLSYKRISPYNFSRHLQEPGCCIRAPSPLSRHHTSCCTAQIWTTCSIHHRPLKNLKLFPRQKSFGVMRQRPKTGRIEKQNGRIEKQNGRIEEQNGRIEKQNGRIEKQNGRIEEQNGRIEEQNGRIEKQNGRIEEQNGRIEEQNGRTEEQNGRIEKQNGRIEKQNGRIEEQKMSSVQKWKLKHHHQSDPIIYSISTLIIVILIIINNNNDE